MNKFVSISAIYYIKDLTLMILTASYSRKIYLTTVDT